LPHGVIPAKAEIQTRREIAGLLDTGFAGMTVTWRKAVT
jgi:hypothetical protein